MAKTGYRTTWVPLAVADLEALAAQHRRAFPGNALAIVGGYVKVSVLDAETAPRFALTTEEVRIEWAKTAAAAAADTSGSTTSAAPVDPAP